MAPSKLLRLERLPKKDVLAAVELILDGIKTYNNSHLLRYAKTKSVSNKVSKFIVLKSEERLIGLLMYRIEKAFCLIYEIHVDSGHRCAGEGQRLMDDLLLSKKNFVLILFVHRANPRAMRFYEKNGFKVDKNYRSSLYYRMSLFN